MSLSPDLLDETVARLATPLEPKRFRLIQRLHVARALAELLHEKLLRAEAIPLEDGSFRLRLVADEPSVVWTCRAHHRRLDFWHIEPDSIKREAFGRLTHVDEATSLLLDFRRTIGIEPFTLARFLEETAQTLYAEACIRDRGRPTALALAHADHQTIERSMEGHPWIIANKGRLGFDALAQQDLTPEAGQAQRLVWLAAHREVASYYAVAGLDHDTLFAHELGDEYERLRTRLADRGLPPSEYLFVPVNAWQYTNKIVVNFADEIAAHRLVPLGASAATYRPQQSIRTFQHASRPDRSFIKTTLSILNTGQIRGLSAEKLRQAPRVTEWLRARLGDDPTLKQLGTVLLGEIATLVYPHPAFARIPDAPYQFREYLGALFRESPVPYLRPGETLATMASLLYVDDTGQALIAELATRAAVTLHVWLERYLRAYLWPLLHCFFRHETFFVAHGENTLLVLDEGLPTRVVFKDLVEEIQVSRRVRATLPTELREFLYDIDDALVPLFILTDVLDGFFRYLANVLQTHCGFAEDDFWRLVAHAILHYQQEHPELRDAFARYDLFVPEFPRFCLNKYRLVLFGYAESASNVLDLNPRFDGTLANPLAPFAPRSAASKTTP